MHHQPRSRYLVYATVIQLWAVLWGCAPSVWNGRIEQWGSMRSVLRDGQTEGRVSLADAIARPNAYGVGALEDLNGEVVILDGQCRVAQPVDHGLVRVTDIPGDHRATFLAIAYVPTWNNVDVLRDVDPDELDRFIRDVAIQEGLDPSRPFPFVVTGEFGALHAHVVNGACPMQGNVSGKHAPYRLDRARASGTLVGIYAENSAGNLTHHDTSTHLHIITNDEVPIAAHVEQVGLTTGSILRLPRVKANSP